MQRGYAYERQQTGDRNRMERAEEGYSGRRSEHSGSRRRRRGRQRRLYLSSLTIWILAFVIGLLCGKIVFAKDTGLLARAGARFAAEKSENDDTEADGDVGTGEQRGGAGGLQTASAEDGDSWQLTLVNADHPMEDGYRPQVSEIENNYYFDSRAVAALQQMLADGRKEGLDFWICSAYRSIEKQTDLYQNKVSRLQAEGLSYEEAYRQAGTVVAYPGTSEHNLGLAADIVAKDYQLLDDKQADTPEAKWLKENCWRYGFILRYPTDKTEETGIIFEPWHYRYVGKKAAKEIMEQGICLEEYLGVK